MEGKYIDLSYYSKSKVFLYPILGFSRGETFKAQSFLFFREHSIINGEIVVYYPHEGVLFDAFENDRILSHPLLRKCYTVGGGKVYIFNIDKWKTDIDYFLAGEYSKLSDSLKKTVLRYVGDNVEPMKAEPNRYAHAVLFPELYRFAVARDLGVSARDLTELASLYDHEKETLDIPIWDTCNTTTPK